MDSYITKQVEDHGIITRAFTNLKKKSGQNSAAIIQSHLAGLEKRWSRIEDRHRILEEKATDKDRSKSYFKLDWFEDAELDFFSERAKFTEALQLLQPDQSTGQRVDVPMHSSRRKLPPIEIPCFSGNYADWHSFKDFFTALIINDRELLDVERLQYLKKYVSGDAANLIKNIPVSSENYARAWQKLQSHFDNKRVLIQSYLNTLFQTKPMQFESHQALENLREAASEAYETMQVLGRQSNPEDFLVFSVIQRFDPSTRRDWELSLGDSTEPIEWNQLDAFMKSRIQALKVADDTKSTTVVSSKKQISFFTKSIPTSTKISAHTASQQKSFSCALCNKNHTLTWCDKFKSYSLDNRLKFVTERKLCFNCLRSHNVTACQSKVNCNICKQRHHTLLHRESQSMQSSGCHSPAAPSTLPVAVSAANQPSQPSSIVTAHTVNSTVPVSRSIILATARLFVTVNQRNSAVRALIDPCSEASFISESLAQRLRLPRLSVFVPVTGVGAAPSCTARSSAVISFTSRLKNEKQWEIQALILPKLTEYLPSPQIVNSALSFMDNLCLADPHIESGDRIEMILGADVYPKLIENGLRKSTDGQLIAQSTSLGWILTGSTVSTSHEKAQQITSLQCILDKNLSSLVERFWQQEEASPTKSLPYSADELDCENHFLATHKRDEQGRYVLRLPFHSKVTQLGDSHQSAMQTFQRTEKRFTSNPQLKIQYTKFMEDYLSSDHMKEVSLDCSSPHSFFLPHHGVFKAHGDTSKLRVVFNGSVKLSNGLSLNDCLHPGPKLQLDIFDILLSWRKHRFVFSADIKQMFRQIRIDDEDQRFQQILWRNNQDKPISTFQLATVTYGLASSPYQAIRTLLQLASDEENKFPRAAEIVRENSYVDDVFAGADTISDTLQLKSELIQLLMAGGFPLSKWTSNHREILADLPREELAPAEKLTWQQAGDSDAFRMLGVSWQSTKDLFIFEFNKISTVEIITKRKALSIISQLYDPLGWITPVTVSFKIFLQSLWPCKLQWDEPLPSHLQSKWNTLIMQLPQLQHIAIPRWIGYTNDVILMELHGFSDASERAYAACVYLRTIDSMDNTNIILLSSKSKVAPLKQVSLPRLELSGALILAQLIKRVQGTLSLQTSDELEDLRRKSSIRDTNSVAKCLVAPRNKQNPADLASRGVSPQELADSQLWLNGPSFLKLSSQEWPVTSISIASDSAPERRGTACLNIQTKGQKSPEDNDLLSRLRKTSTTKFFNPQNAVLAPNQLDAALKYWIAYIQQIYYKTDISYIKANNKVSEKSSLLKLNPHVDNEGLLRVGGRLQNSLLHPDEKHPIILPRDSYLTWLLIHDAHEKTLHGGAQLMLNFLRQRFWIIRGRQLIRTFVFKCLRCWKQRPKPTSQLMGNLPYKRVQQFRPFLHTGVDYAGPIFMRLSKGRGTKSFKGYIAVFVCLSTRAVHLEAVSGYSTADFLSAFRRFVARRGRCATMTSDCGTNFIGADKELRMLFQQATSQSKEIAQLLANDGTEWKFNPPSAPHFGGIWEAAVKSVKFHLKRVIGDTLLTFEEMTTLLTQIEACLNSRPLLPLTDDPADLSALTPAHFLIGMPTLSIPEPSLQEIPLPRLNRWQLIQQLHKTFRKRWSNEYLQNLQERPKWCTKEPPVKIGDLCLVRTSNLPPCKWPLARIISTQPGSDGLPRVVQLRTASSTLTRPIAKISLLPERREEFQESGEGGRDVWEIA